MPRGAPFASRSPLLLLRMLERTRHRALDDVLVLDLSGDVCAHARRTLPRHGRGAAAARRGQRRAAAVGRSGRVEFSALSGVGLLSGRAARSGRSRSRCIGRGASPPTARRSCVRSCAYACAGRAARWPDRVVRLLCCACAMSDHVCMATAYETNDMCTCDVFVSSPDIKCG